MIDNIKRIVLTDVLQNVRQGELNILAASGSLERTFGNDDHGNFVKYKFVAKIPKEYRYHPLLDCDLIVRVITEDGEEISIGSDDFTVRLSKEISQFCKISAEYTSVK